MIKNTVGYGCHMPVVNGNLWILAYVGFQTLPVRKKYTGLLRNGLHYGRKNVYSIGLS